MSEERKFGWALALLSFAVAAVVALLTASSGLPAWIIAVLLVFSGICFSCGLWLLSWRLPIRILVVAGAWVGVALLGWKVWPVPQSPTLAILGYEVILFKTDQAPFANIFFRNIGGEGRIAIYSAASLARSTGDSRAITNELANIRRKLVLEGGGLLFNVKAQEGRWFTVMGSELDREQAQRLRRGEYAFYFSATIVNGDSGRNYDLCSFVIGDKPKVILQCPEK